MSRLALVLPLLMVAAALSAAGPVPAQLVVVQIGPNLPPAVARRVLMHVEAVAQWPVVVLPPTDPVRGLANGSLVLALGNTTTTRALISADELAAAGWEGYVVKRSTDGYVLGSTVLAGDGNGMAEEHYVYDKTSIGAAYAAYHILETVGFAFLHAFAPYHPASLVLPTATSMPESFADSPRWSDRLWHIHTQHPLELTDLLNGFDIADPKNNYNETFESMLSDWEDFLEWSVANHQNRVEWILLLSPAWTEFGKSEQRKNRLRTLVSICHDYAMPCGVDVPIALQQQHSWTMIGSPLDGGDDIANMHTNIDWWMDAQFDFLTTESGFSEFTKGNCTTMLAWMNEATRYLADVYGRELHIKVHISSGQYCEEFTDPQTGGPLNFNFLPIYADPRLVISPHTVQFYSFDEPTDSYGQSNFSFMYEFMFQQAKGGERGVMWYPEAAYYVNFDINVPLFLPIYGYNRLRDLRYIAHREAQMGAYIKGQTMFESGWEWSYWLSNSLAARAAYNPRLDLSTDDDAFVAMTTSLLRPFGHVAADVASTILDYAKTEKALLIEGRFNGGSPPSDISRRNGIAYIEGWDTFSDIGALFENFLNTQPDRLSLLEFRPRPNRTEIIPDYPTEVKPLLEAMEVEFGRLQSTLQAWRPSIPTQALPLFDDLDDSAAVLLARTTQIHALYDYASTWRQAGLPSRQARLRTAMAAMTTAERVIRRREAQYAVPLLRIAGWRENPTVYENMYLWTVKSLYFFYRDLDQAQAESRDVLSPCFMNIISPVKVGLGDGHLQRVTEALRAWADETRPGNHFLIDCISAPMQEPVYPLDKHPRPTTPVADARDLLDKMVERASKGYY